MATYKAWIHWERSGATFTDVRYSRAHRWRFDGGTEVHASSSPHHVPLPMSDPAGVDPEEAFVAALSSCHMLCFLSIAAKRGFVVEQYVDEATGTMGKNANGRLSISRVVLRPRVRFAGDSPDEESHRAMHHAAHDDCYIASSVSTEVACEASVERE